MQTVTLAAITPKDIKLDIYLSHKDFKNKYALNQQDTIHVVDSDLKRLIDSLFTEDCCIPTV